MISTDFAPNESWDDAWESIKLLLKPWIWQRGKGIDRVRKWFQSKYQSRLNRDKYQISFFLSGRAALYFLLKSFNLPKNSAVLIQAFTCEAVILPILANDLKPIYIDIESDTFSMSLKELTNRTTDNCRVLILQHSFGLTPKFRGEIINFARQHKLFVIEDLAHGFNPKIFSSNFEHLTSNFYLLSFGRSKVLSSVFGGAIVSTDNRSMEKLNNQMDYLPFPSYWFILKSLLYKPLAMLIKSTYDIFYLGKILHKIINTLALLIPEITSKEKNGRYDELFNKVYPNALSLLLHHQLNKFEQIQKTRAIICKFYNEHLKNVSSFMFHVSQTSMIRYPLLVNNRDELIIKMKKHNIFLGSWYDQVVAPKDLRLDRVGYKPGSCPKAEEICKKIINLPTNITEKQAKRVVKILNDSL